MTNMIKYEIPACLFEVSGDLASWKTDFSFNELETNLFECIWNFENAMPETLPKLVLSFRIPQTDSQICWHPRECLGESHHLFPWWWHGGNEVTSNASGTPVWCYMNTEGVNTLSFALSETTNICKTTTGIRSPEPGEDAGFIINDIILFSSQNKPQTNKTIKLLLDLRHIFYSKSLKNISNWYVSGLDYKPLNIPKSARLPVYSTWNLYQKKVSAEELERMLPFVAECGFDTFILDDGWECETNVGGGSCFAQCAEWTPDSTKFPDIIEHIKNFHAQKINYLMWFAVPFVGLDDKEILKRFEGKFLGKGSAKTMIWDPRYPEVREYLKQVYVKAVKDWKLDGLKLDFIEAFKLQDPDPAAENNFEGCDEINLHKAIEKLLDGIITELVKIKPDIMIEFRQPYNSPGMRQYANIFRASDCAHDILQNRCRITDIRLLSGNTAVHADIISWSKNESAEVAALQILNTLFAVPQISMRLDQLPETHRKMLRFWLSFMKEHSDTLQEGDFLPEHPEMSYPVISAEGKDEIITAVYLSNMVIACGNQKKQYFINAKHSKEILIRAKNACGRLQCFNVFGEETVAKHITFDGLATIEVPPSGFAVFTTVFSIS